VIGRSGEIARGRFAPHGRCGRNSRFAAMRIETGDRIRGAGCRTGDQLRVENGMAVPGPPGQRRGTSSGRVRRRECDAQPPGEHHDHLSGTGTLGEILRVADEKDPAVVDDALCTGAVVSARTRRPAARNGTVEKRNHVGALRRSRCPPDSI